VLGRVRGGDGAVLGRVRGGGMSGRVRGGGGAAHTHINYMYTYTHTPVRRAPRAGWEGVQGLQGGQGGHDVMQWYWSVVWGEQEQAGLVDNDVSSVPGANSCCSCACRPRIMYC
jgi:hypothetical protein